MSRNINDRAMSSTHILQSTRSNFPLKCCSCRENGYISGLLGTIVWSDLKIKLMVIEFCLWVSIDSIETNWNCLGLVQGSDHSEPEPNLAEPEPEVRYKNNTRRGSYALDHLQIPPARKIVPGLYYKNGVTLMVRGFSQLLPTVKRTLSAGTYPQKGSNLNPI